VQAQALQDDERDEDESHVAYQCLIHTTLTRRQTAELFDVSEKGLDRPAASLPQHDGG